MNFSDVDRRSFIKMGMASLAATSQSLTFAQPKPTSLTVADPGGPYGPGFRKAFYDPFEQATGIKVVNVARVAEPVAQFKSSVETKAYIWDVCTLTLSARDILAKQNLLEPIGFELKDAPGLMPEAITPLWMGTDVFSTMLVYRKDKYGANGPKSWADFWDVNKFPGRRSLAKSPIDVLEIALLADGVPLDKLYPLDVDRAYKSLDRIKPHINVWWTGGAQTTQLIQSNEVDMIGMWNARAQVAVDSGAPVEMVWNQGLYSIEGWGIPRGCPKADPARQFVKFCASAKQQALFTEVLSYGPSNLDSYKLIAPQRAKALPTSEANLKLMTLARPDWWGVHQAAQRERFNAWIIS